MFKIYEKIYFYICNDKNEMILYLKIFPNILCVNYNILYIFFLIFNIIIINFFLILTSIKI